MTTKEQVFKDWFSFDVESQNRLEAGLSFNYSEVCLMDDKELITKHIQNNDQFDIQMESGNMRLMISDIHFTPIEGHFVFNCKFGIILKPYEN